MGLASLRFAAKRVPARGARLSRKSGVVLAKSTPVVLGDTRMNLRFLGVIAVAVMLAACASKKEQAAGTTAAATPPAPPAARSGPAPDSIEYFNTVVGNMVQFGYDKYDLEPAAQ